ncbi:MAG: TRAP transporter small permease [Candidatus Latescibacterota bacterium]|nr:MAG: TRAP transporter small permease [Candidatus Latescibacterota bacterium]
MDGSPTWLQNLPVDRGYVLWAFAFIAVWSLLRLLLDSHRAGKRLIDTSHLLEGALLALLLGAMIGLSFLQIVLRNLANSGLIWIDPLLRHLVLWIGFLGAMLSTRVGRHINVDALSRFMPRSLLRVVRVTTNLLAAFVCLLLSNASLKLVRDEAAFGSTGFLGIPVWVLQIVMPIATLVMSSRFVGHALAAARGRNLEADAEASEVRA